MPHITKSAVKTALKRFFDKPAVRSMFPVSKADRKRFFRDWLVIFALVCLIGYGSVWRWVGLRAWPHETITLLPLYAALIAFKFTFYKWWMTAIFNMWWHKLLFARPLPPKKKRL